MRRKLSLILALAMMLSVMIASLPAAAEAPVYSQSPFLDERVASGELPPVEERLPKVTKLPNEILPEYLDYEIGKYGGTLRFITSQVNWDADLCVINIESFLNMESVASDQITPNILESYQVSEDQTQFTFKLREGLKWSDGVPVTMEDIEFGIKDFVFNPTLNPAIPAWMRDGGVTSGDPFVFEVVDDWTFTITFSQPYGGFTVHMSIAGWKAYTEMMKPAHFLKPFHPDYAEEIHGSVEAYYDFLRPYGKVMGYEDVTEDDIFKIFEQVDCTNWAMTNPNKQMTSVYFKDAGHVGNFPVLYPWIMVSSEGGVTTYERNPYYHKVDAAGQQLPYIDKLTSTLVEDMEMVQMKYVSGEADFGRESAGIDNISLYKENEERAGITAYVTRMHVNPTDYAINVNFADEAWQEVVNDVRFRKALAIAVDAEEILDSVYKGFAEVNPYYQCSGDVEGANALLDEMGMERGPDGFRTTPSGKPLSWSIVNGNEANDLIPVAELLVEFWSELGLKVDVKTVQSALLGTMIEANEVPMRVSWLHSTQLWHYLDWGQSWWAPLWNLWWTRGQANDYEPPEDVKEIYLKIESLMTEDPAISVQKIVPELATYFGQESYYICEPLINVQQCVLINSDIGNVPTDGVGISWNFSGEQFFYK